MQLYRRIIGCLIACLTPGLALAANPLPRSMLVLDQSDVRGPFYRKVFSGLRATVNAGAGAPITIYAESLDLSRFSGLAYEESLLRHFQAKYLDKSIGVVVAIGSASLDYVLRWRSILWPDVPIVFSMVDEPTVSRLNPPRDVTGSIMKLPLVDMMTSARAVVPDLKRVAFIGDAWERQTAFGHWKDEIPIAAAGVEVIDLTGLTMRELQNRVADLPDRTAILYSAIYSDGAGTFYPPADAVALLAERANRPIVIAAETFLGRGGIGGFVMTADAIGNEAAQLALRILNGESVTSIPAAVGNIARPIFDWRQMQRWGVSESSLPAGSEIRFRDQTTWEQYRWRIVSIAMVLLLQAALIIGLLYEHRRRRNAEVEARRRMSELAHMNRRATVGELSASIAHELNQPLGAILNNAEAAELLLACPSPNLNEIKEILVDIRRDDQRASEVIKRLRRLLAKAAFRAEDFDLNETVREVFEFLSIQASARNVTLSSTMAPRAIRVSGDRIQLQQVILNLVVNGMEAMISVDNAQRKITTCTALKDGTAEVSIADCGPGIPPDKLAAVFEPFFTTKEQGMGMGLSIARTIVEAHGGRIWAESEAGGGAVFRLSLPLVRAL